METTKLRRFAQFARRTLRDQVSAKMAVVLANGSAARRESAKAVQDLQKQIDTTDKDQVVEKVAYTWFNRFCALRYMDVNSYNRIGVVSPLDGQFQPEILAEAKMGHIDDEMVPAAIQAKVRALLDGTAPSSDPQQEAYRLLVVAVCNHWQPAMPFLYERIADYTELLMPDDLLSGNSILAYTREAMTPDACGDVEVIGWLYQFYISEKKDAVFEGLKKNKKITPENIPAATQLFTPHWIVRYLVENSLGRLWLLNRPKSRLAERMDYYIAPQGPVVDFLHIAKPEDIKLCDPACGSGHMLTYAFDLLYAIYEEEGADPAEIPEKILTYNLYGIEIDERAAELAAFALTMKARGKQRRFLNKRIQPNICVLRPVKIAPHNLDTYMAEVGRDLFTANLRTLLTQFEEADNFGSLIRPVAMDYAELRRVLTEKGIGNQLLLEHMHSDVLCVLEQAEYLSQRYQVVVANPPYMGGKGMNPSLGAWAKENYPDSKTDLFAMFIERNLDLVAKQGAVGMITMQSWMFLSSYEKLRANLLSNKTLTTMAHLGPRAFDSIGGEVVSTTAFVFENAPHRDRKGDFLRLVDGSSEAEKDSMILEAIRNRDCGWYHRAASADFQKIAGAPVAYWAGPAFSNLFASGIPLSKIAPAKIGMRTGNNQKYLRKWFEISFQKLGLGFKDSKQAVESGKKWFPYNKGGEFRRWFGNNEYVVNWEDDGNEIKTETLANYPQLTRDNLGWKISNESFYFLPCVTWSFVSSSSFGVRQSSSGFLFDVGGSCAFPSPEKLDFVTGYLCSSVAFSAMKFMNPTLNFQITNVAALPLLQSKSESIEMPVSILAKRAVEISRSDWNSTETAWDFSKFNLLESKVNKFRLADAYWAIRSTWKEIANELLRLEEENNHIFIEAYGLKDEIKPDVPLSEITLTCNPHYRYGGNKSEQELEDLLRADTMRELISYAVGCMFGRYSLDKSGLILASQGETLDDYLREVPEPTFAPDVDNVIPLLDGDWFADDIAERFRNFLRVTYSDEHYEENVKFIEESLGKKGKPQSIRDYFLKDFYTDHVKRYKKRPIYWLFSSPKGSFNALIYMHRYRPDTVGVVLNDYLREFRTKLAARKSHLEQVSISGNASAGDKTMALKEIETLKKNIIELESYERDVLYPLATQQLEIDLDDGVKANYGKFGAALKKIVGLDATED